jgi:hypothetical protein
VIGEYGRRLLPLPDEGWPWIDGGPVGSAGTVLWLDVPLQTVEEGRSDLTLQLTATCEEGKWRLEIDDLWVP